MIDSVVWVMKWLDRLYDRVIGGINLIEIVV